MKNYVIASWETIPSRVSASRSFIGGKAEGLLRLPREWIPELVVLTKEFCNAWQEKKVALNILNELSANEQNLIAKLLRPSLDGTGPSHLIVRSNSPEEYSVSSRGSFTSVIVKPSFQSIGEGIDKIMSAAAPAPVYIILQGYINPAYIGHMSNERRVSQRKSLWLVESMHALNFPEDGYIKAINASPPRMLEAYSQDELLKALRRVAGSLTKIGEGYFHCEWLWDGKRLWIVQADSAASVKRGLLTNRYIQSKDDLPSTFTPTSLHIKHFSQVESGKWKKLERPLTFRKLGLPTGDVYLLNGHSWNNRNKINNSEIERDLSRMCQYPLVVRCDVAVQQPLEDTLLLTSEPITNPARLFEFMNQVSINFAKAQINDTEWSFLLANLYKARASAWVHAYPNGQSVIVDASWGFPDTMQFFPHDTYIYDLVKKKIQKTIRYKGLCLLALEGKTEYSEVGSPHDWASVLRADEIQILADWGQKLAKARGTEVQLMALARLGGWRGPDHCLPWHYTDTKIVQYGESVPNVINFKDIRIIRTVHDLDYLSDTQQHNIKGYFVHPDQSLLRDAEFIRKVARIAADRGLPLYFEGSILGHAYYIMTNEGAHVIRVAPEETGVSKITYGKLVRDKIPAVVQKAGGIARIQSLSKTEAVALLARKLIEEAFEVWNSDKETLIDELADVLEVVDALCEQAAIKEIDLKHVQERKREARGGFRELIYLRETVAKPLRRIDADPTEKFLFDEDADQLVGSSSKKGESQHLEIVEKAGTNIIAEFSVPLVPPVEKGKSVFGSTGHGVKVMCKYTSGKLEVSIVNDTKAASPLSTQVEMFSEHSFGSEGQLALFPEEISARKLKRTKGK
ncbi:MAG: nucleoside triphosphate pyrophosphohydrolase [Pyrinomonadaceae bacterium]